MCIITVALIPIASVHGALFRKYSMHGHWRVSLILDVYLIQHGVTSLFFASQEGHTSVVQLLLEHGAQVDLPNNVRHILIGRRPCHCFLESLEQHIAIVC